MNVLSIDIDVFFQCHTYQKHTNYDIEPIDTWNIIEYLEQTNKYKINTEVDKKALFKVSDILMEKCLGAEVVLINEHNEIVDVLEKRGVKDSILYNIDFHHDITYENDDIELTIENWVRHSKAKGQIKDYHWICREMSDVRVNSPFKYYKTNLEDVIIENMEHCDLVVICISHHFTPRKYWESIPSFLMSYIFNIENFKEISKSELTYDMVKNYDDFLIDNTMPNISRLFRYKDCFIVFEKDTHNVSIINLGDSFNILCSKEVVDYLLKVYKELKFTYVEGIRNVVLINRLLKNYYIVNEVKEKYEDKNIITITFKESEVING